MKIIAVGMNYKAHLRELGDAVPEEPVIFLKPDTALLAKGEPFVLPKFSNELDYETELVIKISKAGKCIAKADANGYFDAITVGIDFTARDLQRSLRAKKNPWELCKAFDQSAGLGDFVPIRQLKDKENITFSLIINGVTKQSGVSSDMIFGFGEIISFVSQYITLCEGDLIYTGTPSGIGSLKAGDILEGFLEGEKVLKIEIS
ncbi:MAG: fumarylacetoacetate hydrolase family protein [Bacteroidales bacterium]|jgi:2-keto-4-pentenoate hydratase/2-oxohepta-3-ene-1,7-dioic acid hydratase in catechol pathway|nr:fumarylacetoacetate hydrolase family protein [Bacteroidales bacterium]